MRNRPGGGSGAAPVYPYPDAPWTSGYQCVEFSERYRYDRYGVTMDIAANGDQVAARWCCRQGRVTRRESDGLRKIEYL